MKTKQLLRGARAALPICLGVIPIGISFGVLALRSGFKIWQTIAMSASVMAGASQIMAVEMAAQQAAVSAIILATLFLNLRHLVMSCSAMNRLREVSTPRRLMLAFALCDESFALFSLDSDADGDYLFGCNTALYLTWILSTTAGCLFSGVLPEIVTRSFGIAIYATFIAMLVPNLQKNLRLLLLVIITALINLALRLIMPPSWAMVLSMILGALLGLRLVEDKAEE
ncbi:MAG: AzlC family ABC transporter permease [Oscillospiraceae bacterium]